MAGPHCGARGSDSSLTHRADRVLLLGQICRRARLEALQRRGENRRCPRNYRRDRPEGGSNRHGLRACGASRHRLPDPRRRSRATGPSNPERPISTPPRTSACATTDRCRSTRGGRLRRREASRRTEARPAMGCSQTAAPSTIATFPFDETDGAPQSVPARSRSALPSPRTTSRMRRSPTGEE